LIVARHQCDASSTFDSIVRGLVRNLPETLLSVPVRAGPSEGCEAALTATPLSPADVIGLISRLSVRALICVVDEFDRVEDTSTRTLLADTIKQVSDRSIPLLFMVIGVSESLEQIIGRHPSIQRSLIAVHLPLLSDENIVRLVEKGAREAGLTFSSELVASVAAIARGMPYIAQLVGLRVAQAAARRGTTVAGEEVFTDAVLRMIGETPADTISRYDEVTEYQQDPDIAAAMRKVAMSSQDSWGHMVAREVTKDTVTLGGQRIDRHCWLRMHKCRVLETCREKPGYVTFADRGLLHYILLQAAMDGALRKDLTNPPVQAVADEGLPIGEAGSR
jgi:hypothetical protein